MKIHRLTDRIPIQIDKITIYVSPLSFAQKSEIQSEISKYASTKDLASCYKGSYLAIKYAVKQIEGVDYELEFEGNVLKDECVEDLLNCEVSTKLTTACISLMNGIPKEIVDDNGNPVEGIKINPKKGKRN